MPERILLTINRAVPKDATLTVEVCNNGNDDDPAWEDATGSVTSGMLYRFTNTTKAADEWGVNVRVSVDRNGAEGECWISSIGGNFD